MTGQPVVVLKRLLLLFWAAYFTIVLATNACDAAKAAGLLDDSWAFASGNYRFVCETTARYGPPGWVNDALFAGVIFWEAAAAASFWWAAFAYNRRSVYIAFTVGLGLWAGFLLADEICIAYSVEGTHLRLLVAQLVTLLVIELVRDEPRE
jgi:hypothetical protein